MFPDPEGPGHSLRPPACRWGAHLYRQKRRSGRVSRFALPSVLPFRLLLLLGLLVAVPATAQVAADDEAQPPMVDPPSPVDVRVLRAIYHTDGPLMAAAMHGANKSSLPIFYGLAPALALGTLAFDGDPDFTPAYRLALTELGTVGMVFALKNVIQRPRPYATWPDLPARTRRPRHEFDPYSFPSGHAATAFAIATSLSLSYPEWYVIVPAATWATAVSLARNWLAVHYPTDTLTGAAIGTGTALAVHLLAEILTPDFVLGDDDGGEARPALVFLRLPF